MAIKDVESKCWILALFVRDDGERFLLGDGSYEFTEKQLHFAANTIANDVVEVQGNDGYLLAGQVRRPSTQSFDGYVGDSSTSKVLVEQRRKAFFAFFRKNHFYKVIYVFPDGSAIQRKRGFLVDAPEVKELWQIYPEYHVALNFEDINYYYYDEDADGEEIYGESAIISLNTSAQSGGLVWVQPTEIILTGEGTSFTLNGTVNNTTLTSAELKGDTYQQTYSGKNLFNNKTGATVTNNCTIAAIPMGVRAQTSRTTASSGNVSDFVVVTVLPTDDYIGQTVTLSIVNITPSDSNTGSVKIGVCNPDGTNRVQKGTLTTDNSSISYTISSSDSSKYIYLMFYAGTSEPVSPGYYIDYTGVQLELGSDPTPYEPYVGGIPAPNPDYPQEVQTVTGRQMMTISNGTESQEYEVNLGKNFCSSVVAPSDNARQMFISNQSNFPKTFTLSFNCPTLATSPDTVTILLYNAVGATAVNLGSLNIASNQKISKTVTLTDEQWQNLVSTSGGWIQLYKTGVWSGAITFDEAQIEKGSVATSYAPYFEPIELCKIGDYQDRIYKSGSDWYLHKAVRHLQLAISNMDNGENNPGWTGQTQFKADLGTTSGGQIYTDTSMITNIAGLVTSDSRSVTKNFNDTNALILLSTNYYGSSFTQSYWKTNYPNLIVDFYYGINGTIADTQITNTALIDQLNALAAATTYNDSTTFTVDGNGNLAAILAVEVRAVGGGGVEWDENGAVWEEGKPSYSIISVDSIDNVYPVLTITGRTVNPVLTDVTTGTIFSYNGTVTESQVLKVDMMNKTATLNGVSVIGNVTGDWLYLAPGNNRITYTADNAGAPNATVEWQEIVG